MTTQVEQRKVTIETILRTAMFSLGVEDARNGIAPRKDILDGGKRTLKMLDAELYERGRMFGVCSPRDMRVKTGLRVNISALSQFANLLRDGSII